MRVILGGAPGSNPMSAQLRGVVVFRPQVLIPHTGLKGSSLVSLQVDARCTCSSSKLTRVIPDGAPVDVVIFTNH